MIRLFLYKVLIGMVMVVIIYTVLIARVRHMNDTGTTYCLAVAFWVQVVEPAQRMGAGWCCRRRSSVASAEDSEDSWRPLSAPSCPQAATPGGSVWQLSPVALWSPAGGVGQSECSDDSRDHHDRDPKLSGSSSEVPAHEGLRRRGRPQQLRGVPAHGQL